MQRRKRTPLITLWVGLAAAGIGIGLFLLVVMVLSTVKPGQGQEPIEPTAVLTIVAAPSSTPPGIAGLFSTSTPTPQAQSITIDGIAQGRYVQISGTGGDGLRLRQEPGTGTPILFLGYESEVFKVTDGPIETDGYVWWYLTAPYDEKRSGWAASNFLKVVQVDSIP